MAAMNEEKKVQVQQTDSDSKHGGSGDAGKDLEKTTSYGSMSSEEVAMGSLVNKTYQKKAVLINHALDEYGMGFYAWGLFFLCGMGWAFDNIWLQAVAVVLPSIQAEFPNYNPAWQTASLYAGLIVGATFWGISADIIGRRLAFNLTLLVTGIFGIAAGGGNTFIAVAGLIAALGFGCGGNLPVDGAIFIEGIPPSRAWLLCLLSVFWAIGQVIGSLIAWPLIVNFSCPTTEVPCLRADNMGWRYSFFTLGGLTIFVWAIRFLIFQMPESPKFLIANGRDEEAVVVMHTMARRNGYKGNIEEVFNLGMLLSVDKEMIDSPDNDVDNLRRVPYNPPGTMRERLIRSRSAVGNFSLKRAGRAIGVVVKEQGRSFGPKRIKPLFATPKIAYSTSLIILIWAGIGIAYPLYNGFLTLYLSAAGASVGDTDLNTTYRNYTIVAVCGVPGSILAAALVMAPRFGRKGTMGLAGVGTGIFLFLFTTARTPGTILLWNCLSAFAENALYGVLYAYSPELFSAPNRGTGDGLASMANRIAGIIAPILKATALANPGSPNAPIYTSASLFILVGLLSLLLPIETQGRESM